MVRWRGQWGFAVTTAGLQIGGLQLAWWAGSAGSVGGRPLVCPPPSNVIRWHETGVQTLLIGPSCHNSKPWCSHISLTDLLQKSLNCGVSARYVDNYDGRCQGHQAAEVEGGGGGGGEGGQGQQGGGGGDGWEEKITTEIASLMLSHFQRQQLIDL